MKKSTIILLMMISPLIFCIFSIYGCRPDNNILVFRNENGYVITDADLTPFLDTNNVIIVQGCEYFVTRQYNNSSEYQYIHKGNCKNPIHNIK